MNWCNFDHSVWQRIIDSVQIEINQSRPVIQGSDRDKGAIDISINNATRAGVEDFIEFNNCSISEIKPPKEPGS